MKKRFLPLVYETVFTILAILAVSIALADLRGNISIDDNPTWRMIDISILIIFALDYFIRLYLAPSKKYFVKHNIPDLIAIIPFSAVFKIFRIAKIFRVAKLTRLSRITKMGRFIAVFTRLGKRINDFLKTNGLVYVIYFSTVIILLSAVAVSKTDNLPFEDAVWWSFVTATTVAYGDFYPATLAGRIIASFLMLVGIGTIGMITGTIATFFIKKKDSVQIDMSDLTDDEKVLVDSYIKFIISRRAN